MPPGCAAAESPGLENTIWPTVPASSSVCGRSPSRRPAALATRPSSGSARPASNASSVDFPAPLRPTTPIRSPADTPSETASSSLRWAYALATFSRLIRFTVLFT